MSNGILFALLEENTLVVEIYMFVFSLEKND